MNSVTLIGRLTADPQTHSGDKHSSATFRLAVARPVGDGTDFVDIVTFDKLAASCGEWLTKGREVAVVGRLRLNEWAGREGERHSRLQVVADTVQFLGAPTGTKPAGSGQDKPADRPALGAYRRKAS